MTVIPFRPRVRQSTSEPHPAAGLRPSSVDLAQFEQEAGHDDYRHRMLVNAAAFIFTVLLVLAGVWLATTMTTMQRNQDCVLAGHLACSPVDLPINPAEAQGINRPR
jgi:hypothetical protein